MTGITLIVLIYPATEADVKLACNTQIKKTHLEYQDVMWFLKKSAENKKEV